MAGIARFLCRYVAFPSEHEPVAIALWVAHGYLLDEADVSPILAVTSAEMRSDKTLVLDCLEFLVHRPDRYVTPSSAAIYTALSEEPRPTLLVDEADAIFTKKRKGDADTEGLRAVFNAGNRRGVTVGRVEMQGKRRKLERLEVFGTKAIAGIGELPPTITDRSIVIRMRRKSRAERVKRFRYRRVQAEAARIAQPDWEAVSLVPDVPDVPEAMSDRAQDMWEPLLAVADAAGGAWPARARQAAVVLSAEEEQRPTLGVQLLIDVRDPLSTHGHMTPAALADVLAEMDESPWADYYGKPITPKAIANLLAPYGISSKEARVDEAKHRYYFAADFEDAWSRYLVGPDLSGTSETTGTTALAQATAQGTASVEIEQDYPASAWSVDA